MRNMDSAPHGLSRRNFLRGMGVCMALPALESLQSATAAAASGAGRMATTATGAPLRTAFVYFPNGAIPGAWRPLGSGADFVLGKTLSPLEAMRNQIQIVAGLDHHCADGGPDGGGDHARLARVFLTGVRLKKISSDIHAGVSIDQVLARHYGDQTRFPSLELSCDEVHKSGFCDSGYSVHSLCYNLSWSGEKTPHDARNQPRAPRLRASCSRKAARGARESPASPAQAEQRSGPRFCDERREGHADAAWARTTAASSINISRASATRRNAASPMPRITFQPRRSGHGNARRASPRTTSSLRRN